MAGYRQAVLGLNQDGDPRWYKPPCLSPDERQRLGFSAPQGYLFDDPRVEDAVQGFLLLGPSAFLLLGVLVRIPQLYRAKIVTVPNYRGVAKLVSTWKPKVPGRSTLVWIYLIVVAKDRSVRAARATDRQCRS
jgi:hypothetical protein